MQGALLLFPFFSHFEMSLLVDQEPDRLWIDN